MDIVNTIIELLRTKIIPLGVIFRVIFCFIKMIYDEESIGTYKKKIRNTISFGIISQLVFVIVNLLQKYYTFYFSGGGNGGGGGGGW